MVGTAVDILMSICEFHSFVLRDYILQDNDNQNEVRRERGRDGGREGGREGGWEREVKGGRDGVREEKGRKEDSWTEGRGGERRGGRRWGNFRATAHKSKVTLETEQLEKRVSSQWRWRKSI